MKNSITYNTKSLKMIENIDGSKTQKKFKTLESLLEDKKLIEDYIAENPSEKINIILK